jgi:hypothetical protein
MPVEIRCVVCGGENFTECPACEKTGRMSIIGCPDKLITPDIWEAIELADLWEKGIAPVLGGSLDQANSFVTAAAFIFSERQFWKAKLGILE